MPQDWETLISVFLAVLGFVTAVVAGINQVFKLRDNLRPRDMRELAELEEDIERLDAQVQTHDEEIEQLKQRPG